VPILFPCEDTSPFFFFFFFFFSSQDWRDLSFSPERGDSFSVQVRMTYPSEITGRKATPEVEWPLRKDVSPHRHGPQRSSPGMCPSGERCLTSCRDPERARCNIHASSLERRFPLAGHLSPFIGLTRSPGRKGGMEELMPFP